MQKQASMPFEAFLNSPVKTTIGDCEQRYFPPEKLAPHINYWKPYFKITTIGCSVKRHPIQMVSAGSGRIKILVWSQMHGNESTNTRALVQLLNFLAKKDEATENLLAKVQLYCIPMLNPDGAAAYTRFNANQIDLNRDAQQLSQPESIALKNQFDKIQPNFCLNLHDQRTIFGAGTRPIPATISFLAPSADAQLSITEARRKSMQLIARACKMLQKHIPDQIGRYDDEFNINCMGDAFQAFGVPTILFEAGHFKNDYGRNVTTELFFRALLKVISSIATNDYSDKSLLTDYHNIPENQKNFCDFIISNALSMSKSGIVEKKELYFQFKEVLVNKKLIFRPVLHSNTMYSHQNFNFEKLTIKNFKIKIFDNELAIEKYLNNIKEIRNWMTKI